MIKHNKILSIKEYIYAFFHSYHGSFTRLAFSGLFDFGNWMGFDFKSSSSILETSKSKKGYFFFCLSLREIFHLVLSWAEEEEEAFVGWDFFVSEEIFKGLVFTERDYLASPFSILPHFQSFCFSLPFFGSWIEGAKFPASNMLTSMSWARVANSSNVLGFMP